MIDGKYQLNSRLACHIESYVNIRRKEGFSFNSSIRILLNLDVYFYDYDLDIEDISNETMKEWKSLRPTEGAAQCKIRNGVLDLFISYLTSLGYHIHLTRAPLKVPKRLPYLLSDQETVDLFTAIDSYTTKRNHAGNLTVQSNTWDRMALEYKVILRLILSCGLRIDEACQLQVNDISWSEQYFLVRKSKGDKDRLVYMTSSMAVLLRDYLAYLDSHYSVKSKWAFPGQNLQKHINKTTLDKKFSEVWETVSPETKTVKHPTVHSLRHKHVINKIDQWTMEGQDLDNKMPYLSKYLGHSDRSQTYYYYHQLQESLTVVRNLDSKGFNVIPEADDEED